MYIYMYMYVSCYNSVSAARMEMDSVHVVKRIVALLVDSFQPSGLSGAEQVCVCVCVCVCVRACMRACVCVNFYQHVLILVNCMSGKSFS